MGLSFGKSFGNHIASVGHSRELITSWNCLFQFCWTYLIVQLSLVSFCRVKLLIWPGIHYCCLDTETDDTTFNKIGKNGGDERNQDRLLEFPVYRISWCVHDIPNKLVSLVFVPVVIHDLPFPPPQMREPTTGSWWNRQYPCSAWSECTCTLYCHGAPSTWRIARPSSWKKLWCFTTSYKSLWACGWCMM